MQNTDLLWWQDVRNLCGMECCRPAVSYLQGKAKELEQSGHILPLGTMRTGRKCCQWHEKTNFDAN